MTSRSGGHGDGDPPRGHAGPPRPSSTQTLLTLHLLTEMTNRLNETLPYFSDLSLCTTALLISAWAQSVLLPFGIFEGRGGAEGKTYWPCYLKRKRKREVKQTCLFKVIWRVYFTPPPPNAKMKQNGLRDMFFPAEKFDTIFFNEALCFPSQRSFLRKTNKY